MGKTRIARLRRLACLGSAAAACFCLDAAAPDGASQANSQGQTIKVKTELVEVRAVVTDRQGRFVENLKKEDFELLENNRPQEISFLSVMRVEQDASRHADAVEKGAGIRSVRERLEAAPARTVVLFVDTLHLSISSLFEVRNALRRFVEEKLTPQDVVAVVTSSGSLGIGEQFTRDRQIVRFAIERLSPGPPARASFFTPYLASGVVRGDPEAMNLAIALLRLEDGVSADRRIMEALARGRSSEVLGEATYLRTRTLSTLKAIAERMTDLPGRRMIALFSDGFSLQDNSGAMQTGLLQSVIGRAVRSGVAIYSIDAKGLAPPPMSNAAMRGGAAGPRLESYMSASEKEVQDGINALAADTGGELYLNTNDLGSSLGRALDANRAYYILGYYLAPGGDSRQFRRVTVRVRDHREYTVRAPRGFLPFGADTTAANRAEKTPQQRMADAIEAPLPLDGLKVSATAEFFEDEADRTQVSVEVHLEGGLLQYTEENNLHHFSLEILTLVFDSSGKRVDGMTDAVDGNLTAERLSLAGQNGYRVSRRLSLKPGSYQVRVAVRDKSSERIGSASAWVEVPDISRAKLALSSLRLLDAPDAARAAGSTPGLTFVSRIVQGIRVYSAGQSLAYAFQVFRPVPAPAASGLSALVELMQGGKVLFQGMAQPLSVDVAGRENRAIAASGQVSLDGMKPGLYELRVTVTDPGSSRTVRRVVVFGVED